MEIVVALIVMIMGAWSMRESVFDKKLDTAMETQYITVAVAFAFAMLFFVRWMNG